jgi:myosin heavy subunit
MFDGVQTMNQLESSGVLGTVKIRKAGYPVRSAFAKFNQRYQVVAGGKTVGLGERELSVAILKACDMSEKRFAQVGKTKVFMKSEAFPLIEHKRSEALQRYVQRVQRLGKGYLDRLRSCRSRAVSLQQRLVSILVDEYRLYLKRSAEVREIRARLRREAEEKYRHLRADLEVQSATARTRLYEEMLGQAQEMHKLLWKRLQAERARMEQLRAAREAIMHAELAERVKLFEEASNNVAELQQLYEQELIVTVEIEFALLVESEGQRRQQVAAAEADARNILWRSFMAMQSQRSAALLRMHAAAGKERFAAVEELSRLEIYGRAKLLKSFVVSWAHLQRHRGEDYERIKRLERTRRQSERQRDKELHLLDSLLREEAARLRLEELERSKMQRRSAPGECQSLSGSASTGEGHSHHQLSSLSARRETTDALTVSGAPASSPVAPFLSMTSTPTKVDTQSTSPSPAPSRAVTSLWDHPLLPVEADRAIRQSTAIHHQERIRLSTEPSIRCSTVRERGSAPSATAQRAASHSKEETQGLSPQRLRRW